MFVHSSAFAINLAQFRGPNGAGVSSETNRPTRSLMQSC